METTEVVAPQTLAEELGGLIDAGGNDAVPNVATDTGVVETTEQAEQRARDEKGRFVAKEEAPKEAGPVSAPEQTGQAAPAEVAPQAALQATEAPQIDAPPSTWTPAAKAEWSVLSPVVKAELKKREVDFQKGITQYKQAADYGTSIMTQLQPYEPMIRAVGATPEQAVGGLLAREYRLRTGSPQERGQIIARMVQELGADMSPWMGQPNQQAPVEGQPVVDQRQIQAMVAQMVQPYTQQFQKVQSQLSAQEQQRQQAQQQAALGQIEAFKNEADQKGQAKHVYFDNVQDLMIPLLQSGQAKSLEQAYEMACRAHPEVSQALTVEQRRKTEAEQLDQARKKTEEAKRAAGANVSGQGGVGLADVSKVSLADELKARLEGSLI